MTWFVNDDGYELFFNRDERITRSRALAPTLQQHSDLNGGLSYISPTDSEAGGTWIAVNEYGVTVCLLNHYQFQQIETYKNWTSRGEIVRQFSSLVDLAEAESLFKAMNLDDYRAFRMFVIEPAGNNRLLVWDGHAARVERNVASPKSSSSVDAKHVKARRKQLFYDLGLENSTSAKEFIAYHSSHHPERSKESVCMHRADAKTVSLSHVKVGAYDIEFRYADGSPCEATLSEPVMLDLCQPEKLRSVIASAS